MAGEGGYGQAGQFNQIAMAAMAANTQMSNLTRSILGTGLALQGISTSISAFAQLQQTLTLTQAVASGTTAEFEQMGRKAREMALALKYSANEGASAMYFLASAGFSVQQSMSAMNGVMLLAQATLSDVSTVADTVASSIQAFGLRAGDATRVSNLFSASINASQATIEKLAFSMRQVGPVASSMGLSIEETVTQLSTLYNVGLRGEQAGTALRNVLVRLANPTAVAKDALAQMGVATQDTSGKLRNLQDILSDLRKVAPDTSTLKVLVEDEALPGVQALLQATKDFDRVQMDSQKLQQVLRAERERGLKEGTIKNELDLMRVQLTGTNSAVEVALKQMTTLQGSMDVAKNAVVDLGITLGQDLAPSIIKVSNAISDAVLWFRGMNDSFKTSITTLPLLIAG